MVRRAPRSQRKDPGAKLKGFVLMDLDTLIYGPINLRAPSGDILDFDGLLRVFRNNLRHYLLEKTTAQRIWCVNRLIEECRNRENSIPETTNEREFYKLLNSDLMQELK